MGGDSSKRARSAYDFRGVNDYAPIQTELSLSDVALTPSSMPMFIVVTNDQVCSQ